jgi:3-hydroxyisobutyryl-CoA hydrolase
VDKIRDRPAWSPSTLDEVSEDFVIHNFFSSQSPYIKPKPELNIPDGLLVPNNTNRFAMPSAGAVRRYILNDGAKGVTRNQVIQHFEERTNWKGGVTERILDILNRKTKVQKDPDTNRELIRWIEYL